MAVYEYRCSDCGRIQEHDVRADSTLICSDDHPIMFMKRVYSLGGITFRGPGFYKNDKK